MAGYIGSKVAVVSSGAERKKVFTATSGQTSFTGLSYTVNNVHVFQNGVRLVDGTDYTATNGNSITLTVGAATDDQVVVVSYNTFQTSDTVSASAGGTFSNAVTVDADGATVLTVDRATSDGTIIDVQKSGSSVGSIGVEGGNSLYIHSGDTGLRFSDSANKILPVTTAGSARDNAITLGSSGARFVDLYLSGGVYLGGTGAANKLDDYETGSWTPGISFGGNTTGQTVNVGVGKYVKVGGLVTVFGVFVFSNKGTATGNATLTGLPITAAEWTASTSIEGGTIVCGFSSGVATIYNPLMFAVQGGATVANAYSSLADGGSLANNVNNTHFSNSSSLRFSGSYYAGSA